MTFALLGLALMIGAAIAPALGAGIASLDVLVRWLRNR